MAWQSERWREWTGSSVCVSLSSNCMKQRLSIVSHHGECDGNLSVAMGNSNTCRGSCGNGSGLMRLRAVLDAMRTLLTSVDIFVTAYPDLHKNIAVLFAHEHDEGCLISLLF